MKVLVQATISNTKIKTGHRNRKRIYTTGKLYSQNEKENG